MFCFTATEVLGGQMANEEVFQVFLRLKEVSSDIARKFVPHGLEHIVSDSGNQELAKRAMKELLALKADQSPSVREEVEESPSRLRAKTADGRSQRRRKQEK